MYCRYGPLLDLGGGIYVVYGRFLGIYRAGKYI